MPKKQTLKEFIKKSNIAHNFKYNYDKSIYFGKILENTREFIDKKELNIYFPELKLAFEYDGKYWHQLKEEKEPGYHDLKDSLAKEKNIELIHIKEED